MDDQSRKIAVPDFLMKSATHESAPVSAERPQTRPWQLHVVLIVLVFIAFGPALTAGFLRWDDRSTVFENPDFLPAQIRNFGHYWTAPYLQLYMPLTYSVWGMLAWLNQHAQSNPNAMSPSLFHAFAVALHAGCCSLSFLILRRLVNSDWAALAGAVLFGLHPLQTESVAWVTASSIPLSTFFALLALLQYLRFSDSDENGRKAAGWIHFGIATLAFALAMLSKSSALVLPAIVAVIEVLLRRRPIRSLWPLLIWLAMTLPVAWMTRSAQPAHAIRVELWQRPIVALDALAFYLWKLLIPIKLLPDYGRTPSWVLSHPQIAGLTWLAPAALCGLCIVLWIRGNRWAAAAVSVFLLGLFPILGFVPFVFQYFSTVADRYVYLAMLGPAIAFAHLVKGLGKQNILHVVTAAAVVLGALCFFQNLYWRDTPTLFGHTVEQYPDSLIARRVLGSYDVFESENFRRSRQATEAYNRLQDAMREYQAGLKAHPADSRLKVDIATVLYQLGKPQDALDQMQPVLNDQDFMELHPLEVYQKLGIFFARLGRRQEAANAFNQALKLKADDPIAQKGLERLRSVHDTAPATREAGSVENHSR